MASIIKSNTYADFNGREIITANNDGALTTQKILYPAFYGRLASNQTLSRGVETKITPFTTNEIDTDSAFDGTTFTVPSDKAGNYFITAQVFCDFESAGNDGESMYLDIDKNQSRVSRSQFNMSGSARLVKYNSLNTSVIIPCVAGDEIEVFAFIADNSASGTLNIGATNSFFQGFRLGS